MISKKTKKLKKRLSLRKKIKIIDVPLSKEKSKGSMASLGNIDYHYQEFSNTFNYFNILLKRNKRFRKFICIPDVGESWMRAFLVQEFTEKSDKYDIMSIKPVDNFISIKYFVKKLNKCLRSHQIVPVNFTLELPNYGKHANMIVFDSKKKTIEHFEPHGFHEDSQWSISRAYLKSISGVKRFSLKYFPGYRVISPKDFEPRNGLQSTIDAFSGMCVTWSILYLNYKILNPTIPIKILVRHINKKIKRNELLRFTRYVELTLKKYQQI
tara:strand:+ start:684 stop:1487 length:804 start_codon:yes stop_codon:yes gene_type:complete